MCAVCGSVRQRRLAVHLQSLRTKQPREERRQILDGRVDDVRILRTRIRRDGEQTQSEQHTLHGWVLSMTVELRIQNSELRISFLILNSQFLITCVIPTVQSRESPSQQAIERAASSVDCPSSVAARILG